MFTVLSMRNYLCSLAEQKKNVFCHVIYLHNHFQYIIGHIKINGGRDYYNRIVTDLKLMKLKNF
jgi:hypothetical protein